MPRLRLKYATLLGAMLVALATLGASCRKNAPSPALEPEFSMAPPEMEITPLPDERLAELPEPEAAPEETAVAPTWLAQVPVGRSPYGVGLSPNGAYVYIANHQDGTLSVLSTVDHTRVALVPIGTDTSPYSIAVDPTGGRIYVSTFNGRSVAALEGVRFTLLKQPTHLPSFTEGIAVTPDGKQVLVSETMANKLAVLDADTMQVTKEVLVGAEPHGIVVSSDGRAAYVALGRANTVAEVGLPEGVLLGAPIRVGDSPRGLALSPSGDLLAVSEVGSHSISLISTVRGEIVGNVKVGRQPVGVCFSPYGRYVYVANFGSRSLMAVSVAIAQQSIARGTSQAVRARLKLAVHPWAVAATGDGRLVYVTGQDRNVLEVIATNGMI